MQHYFIAYDGDKNALLKVKLNMKHMNISHARVINETMPLYLA